MAIFLLLMIAFFLFVFILVYLDETEKFEMKIKAYIRYHHNQ